MSFDAQIELAALSALDFDDGDFTPWALAEDAPSGEGDERHPWDWNKKES